MKLKIQLPDSTLHRLCRENGWCKCCSSQDYSNLIFQQSLSPNLDLCDILNIALDIVELSDLPREDLSHIVHILLSNVDVIILNSKGEQL